MTRRHTVLLADDHTIVTDGLSRILREADFEVVGAVRDGQRLIDAATRLRPDVIITDLSMPGLTGLDVLARLKTERLDSKVIVLTMHHDADLATDAIRGGARLSRRSRPATNCWSPFGTRSTGRSTSRRPSRRRSWSAWPAPEGEGTAADATTTRHLAADREGPAHEGDRVESGPVDEDG